MRHGGHGLARDERKGWVMDALVQRERDRLILSADVKTLRDISNMLVRDGRFTALPSILDSIANDISSILNQEEMSK